MHKKNYITAITAMAVILLFLSVLLPCGTSLIIRDSGGKVYFEKNVEYGDIISLGFTHSVEKVPDIDTFIISADNTFLLVNTTFGSTGAGIPSETSYNITTDGKGNFTINDINQTFERIRFMTGRIPKHYLIISGENYPIFQSVPEDKPIFISIEPVTPINVLLNAIQTYI